MSAYYADDWLTIYQGDVRAVLPELASDSVDCICTSPPYWGLRDYGMGSWDGGDAACDHAAAKKKTRYDYALDSSPKQQGSRTGTDAQAGMYAHECPACGAVRQDSQIGLERTPEEYVANLVAVFRELRRVLKPSGTCWLNLGDSYAGNGKGDTYSGFNERYHGSASTVDKQGEAGRSRVSAVQGTSVQRVSRSTADYGDRLKPKDLVGIPWRVAFALQADGWYLRSDIIWAKPNPMPESVTDRPTKAHEYLFLLTKSARYYYDADAVREMASENQPWGDRLATGKTPHKQGERSTNRPKPLADRISTSRNLRSVWTIATRPYPGAHFAVFPPELPERCIKAGSSERGVCPDCGKPWERVVERQGGKSIVGPKNSELRAQQAANGGRSIAFSGYDDGSPAPTFITTGWRPTCQHTETRDGERYERTYLPVSAVVLDPFAGSGTTGMVANRLSRRAILIDLNGDYLKQQLKRNAQTPLGLAG